MRVRRAIASAALAAVAVAMVAIVNAGASPSTPAPPVNPAPGKHCDSAVPATGTGAWSCTDSVTHNGITLNFGEPGFAAAVAASAIGQGGGHNASRHVQGARRVLTHTYQDDSSQAWDYGYYTQNGAKVYVGTVRGSAHININGRQIQTTMSARVIYGPLIDPAGYWSNGCGHNSASATSWTGNWQGPRQDSYCNVDSSNYRNTYTLTWYAQTLPYLYSNTFVSSAWQCYGIYPAPCYFGT